MKPIRARCWRWRGRILDLGAGDGETVRLLRSMGFDAFGIDLEPGEGVARGDIRRTPYPDESFDALITQCTFCITGDSDGAFRESRRLLKTGGRLLFSDVSFGGEAAVRAAGEAAGLKVLAIRDLTDLWREYYIESIWRGTAHQVPRGCVKKTCSYWLMVFEREAEDGSVR